METTIEKTGYTIKGMKRPNKQLNNWESFKHSRLYLDAINNGFQFIEKQDRVFILKNGNVILCDKFIGYHLGVFNGTDKQAIKKTVVLSCFSVLYRLFCGEII